MTISVSTSVSEYTVKLVWKDSYGEEVIQNITVDGTVTQTELQNLISYMVDITQASLVKATILAHFAVSGTSIGVAATPGFPVARFQTVRFVAPNSFSPSKPVTRILSVPAPFTGIIGTDGSTVMTDEGATPTSAAGKLFYIANLLKDHLTWRPYETATLQVGNFTATAGPGGTRATIIEGVPNT